MAQKDHDHVVSKDHVATDAVSDAVDHVVVKMEKDLTVCIWHLCYAFPLPFVFETILSDWMRFFFFTLFQAMVTVVIQTVVKAMAAKMVALVVHVVVTTAVVDHVSHVTAKTTLKVDKPMVVKAMRTANKKVTDHHAKDVTTENQKPAEATR